MKESFARIAVIFDRKKTATTKTDGAVEIRVTYKRKQRYFATGVKVKKNEWTGTEVAGRHDAEELNRAIGMRLADVRRGVEVDALGSELPNLLGCGTAQAGEVLHLFGDDGKPEAATTLLLRGAGRTAGVTCGRHAGTPRRSAPPARATVATLGAGVCVLGRPGHPLPATAHRSLAKDSRPLSPSR